MKYLLCLIILGLLACSSSPTKPSPPAKDETRREHKPINYGAGDVVTKSLLDASGNLWFATTEEGVFKYDGASFTNYNESNGLCDNEVWTIIQDQEGTLWFGTGQGLCSYDGAQFTHLPIPKDTVQTAWLASVYPTVNPNGVLSLLQDRQGDFWIGSNGAGAYHYDGETFTPYLKEACARMPDSLHHNVINSILEDAAGNIWFSSFSHGGVSRYDGTSFTHYDPADGLGDDMIAGSYRDRSDQLWFGTRGGGMSRFDGTGFVTIQEAEGRCHNNMATLYEDETGKLWMASYARSGVCWYDGHSFTPLEVANSEKLVDIKCITADAQGNIWFGGRYGILWRYDGETLEDFTQRKYN
ncbi:MAG: two-component regulator propeller domain-containing protein [Bacteroidota bacterium]